MQIAKPLFFMLFLGFSGISGATKTNTEEPQRKATLSSSIYHSALSGLNSSCSITMMPELAFLQKIENLVNDFFVDPKYDKFLDKMSDVELTVFILSQQIIPAALYTLAYILLTANLTKKDPIYLRLFAAVPVAVAVPMSVPSIASFKYMATTGKTGAINTSLQGAGTALWPSVYLSTGNIELLKKLTQDVFTNPRYSDLLNQMNMYEKAGFVFGQVFVPFCLSVTTWKLAHHNYWGVKLLSLIPGTMAALGWIPAAGTTKQLVASL
jgi:hypothetical protein